MARPARGQGFVAERAAGSQAACGPRGVGQQLGGCCGGPGSGLQSGGGGRVEGRVRVSARPRRSAWVRQGAASSLRSLGTLPGEGQWFNLHPPHTPFPEGEEVLGSKSTVYEDRFSNRTRQLNKRLFYSLIFKTLVGVPAVYIIDVWTMEVREAGEDLIRAVLKPRINRSL